MSTYTFPSIVPNESTMEIRSNTNRYQSELSGAIKTKKRSGDYLALSMSFRNLEGANRAELIGFIMKLQGTRHRFSVRDHSEYQRGAFGGTPLVAGANQVGTSITVDGASNTITNWIRSGDRFQVGNELKICTADANSNGSGQVTINFAPRLRTSPADNSAIVTANGVGIFMLAEDLVSWVNRPGLNGPISDINITAIEDVLA